MIINKEVMIEAIRELGHVRVDEVQGVILVRNYDFETTITIKPVYTGNTITRVRTAVYSGLYYEHDHSVKEYKTLVGLINYIATHIPLSETDIYSCKNDRVAKNRFKELIQLRINEYLLFNSKNDVIHVATDDYQFKINVSVNKGEFSATVEVAIVDKNSKTTHYHQANNFAELQSILFRKGVI